MNGLIKVGSMLVNIHHVAWAERDSQGVTLHMAVPDGGMINPATGDASSAGHARLNFVGEEGVALWAALENLASGGE
jgi:hypothetical protein